MNLNRDQVIGVSLSAVGLIVAVFGGLWIATDAIFLNASEIAVRAVAVFMVIAPLFGYGIYRYARGGQQEPEMTEEMVVHRLMMDIINERGQITLADLAQELGTDSERLKGAIVDLLQLRTFSGFVDWEAGIVYANETYRQQAQRVLPQ